MRDKSISGRRVVRQLTDLIAERGKLAMIVSDHGTEVTSNAVLAWSGEIGVERHYISLGRPMQNSFCENLNGHMRDKLTNKTLFMGEAHSPVGSAACVTDYKRERLHLAPGYATPTALGVTPWRMVNAMGIHGLELDIFGPGAIAFLASQTKPSNPNSVAPEELYGIRTAPRRGCGQRCLELQDATFRKTMAAAFPDESIP